MIKYKLVEGVLVDDADGDLIKVEEFKAEIASLAFQYDAVRATIERLENA